MDADRPSRTAALAARLEAARGRAEALPGGSVVRATMDLVWGLWLLPRRATRVRELLPGAALVAGGVQLVQLAVIVYFAPRLERSEETYGALGVAATMLVWLYVVSRLVIGAAFLNATLWSRARSAEPAETAG